MEHLKTIETSLTLVKAAQDEAASLEEQLGVAKAQYSEWADKTEADHAKEVAALKDEVKMLISDVKVLVNRLAAEKRDRIIAEGTHKIVYQQYEEKCKFIIQMGKNHDEHVKLLSDRIKDTKMVQVEMDALKASLIAEKNKNKTLVDTLSNMLVVEPFEEMPEATCVRCKRPVFTHGGKMCFHSG